MNITSRTTEIHHHCIYIWKSIQNTKHFSSKVKVQQTNLLTITLVLFIFSHAKYKINNPQSHNIQSQIEVSGGKKAVVVFVPFPSLNAYHRVQIRLSIELEKKLPDHHVIFLAERRILPKPARKSRKEQKRPRSRTLTSVQDKILDDLVFPTEISGKRVRYAVGGARVQKVFLKNKDSSAIEHKLDSFQAVYKKLTGKDVVFEIEGEN